MKPNRKEIIVNGTIGNQQKQIILSKEPFTNIYHITIDNIFQGQVIKMINDWGVYPHEESWLKSENCDMILQAVLNAENPNSQLFSPALLLFKFRCVPFLYDWQCFIRLK